METLALIIIVAFATSYVTEVLAVWLQRLSFIKTLTNLLIPPLAFFAFWLLDMSDVTLVLSTLAASFISTAVATGLRALSTPKIVTRGNTRY